MFKWSIGGWKTQHMYTTSRVAVDQLFPMIGLFWSQFSTLFNKILALLWNEFSNTYHPILKQIELQLREFFQWIFQSEGENLFACIIRGETWVHHTTPETKQQNKAWKTADESTPKETEMKLSSEKVTATKFWDNKGVLLVKYLIQGTSINTDIAKFSQNFTWL